MKILEGIQFSVDRGDSQGPLNCLSGLDLKLLTSNTLISMCILTKTALFCGGLRGQGDLNMTLISMCMLTKTALYCDGLRDQGNLNMTSEATSDLIFESSGLKTPLCYGSLASKWLVPHMETKWGQTDGQTDGQTGASC